MKSEEDDQAMPRQSPPPFSNERHRAPRSSSIPGAFESFGRPRDLRSALRNRRLPPCREAEGAAASERGAALITMMLVGVLAAGLLSMNWLESVDRDRHLLRRNEHSLSVTKDALIGYSAAYPDTHDSKRGAGRLPCVDNEADGSADPNLCDPPTTARFPWRQLGLVPHGGRNDALIGYLWYAVDGGFSAVSKKKVVNMNTKPDLRVDDRDGVVAVIIAPGAPLDFQDRSRGGWDPKDHLEAENATSGDGEFTYGRVMDPNPRRFNDRLAVLARDELMDVVARRVLAALRAYIDQYRNADWNEEKILPWLVPASNMDSEAVATVGTRRGWLPMFAIKSQFKSPFSLAGSLEGGKVKGSVDADALVLPEPGLLVNEGICIWQSFERAECEGKASASLPDGRVLVYTIDIDMEGEARLIPPSVSDIRRREVEGTKWKEKSTIEIHEHKGEPATEENRTRRGTVRFVKDESIDKDKDGKRALSVRGIAFPPSASEGDPDRLPHWLPENDWHRLLWVEIAPPFVVGGSGSCLEGDCLSVTRGFVDGRHRQIDEVAMVFLLAGSEIVPRSEEEFNPSQWFEGKNAIIGDGRYEMRLRTPDFNDHLDALDPDFFRASR